MRKEKMSKKTNTGKSENINAGTIRLTEVVRAARKSAERGMTLVEIMVVVVIIALVGGIAGVQVFNVLGQAKVDTAKNQMHQIGEALDLYKLSSHNYPSTAEGLNALMQPKNGTQPLMAIIPKDPWDNDYVYVYPGSQSGLYDLMSYGADGIRGGTDDIIKGGAKH